jgi:signal transduction histidine kinase
MFSVQDNGIGIKPADAAKIFAPLKRLHGPEISGAGLGLAICKSIVGRRGGYIWMESMPNEGSKFRLTWPI